VPASPPDKHTAAEAFRRLEEVALEERRRRYRSTTMGERIEAACALSDFGRELQAGLRPKR
jgi:hypothetical protein